MRIHAYDKGPNDEVGPAGVFRRTYSYVIAVNEAGQAVSGYWTSRHPDFFWVPLGPGDCDSKNPVVHEAWLKEIDRLANRSPLRALAPKPEMLPGDPEPAFEDKRPPGAAIPDATPPPAGSQPDEGN